MGYGWTPSIMGGVGMALIVLWSLVWKGLALWHSAKRTEKWWFIAFLIINTLGILEIIYLYFITKERPFMKKPSVSTAGGEQS